MLLSSATYLRTQRAGSGSDHGRVGVVIAALEELLRRHVEAGTIPGAVGLLGSGDVAVVAAGRAAVGGAPLRDDAIMRIQSMTRPITTVAALRLLEAGLLGLDQSLEEWLPELAERRVLTSPTAALDDTVPMDRAITLRHLLTNGSGYGMALVSSPLQQAMADNGTEAGPEPPSLGAEEWLSRLAELPLAFQGQGTDFFVDPDGTVGILLTQVELGAQMMPVLEEFQALT
jgi:CubicO group peptidase (beta-lactamase class C family)